MHSLTIVFGPSPVPWVLLFKTKESAETARMRVNETNDMLVADDFGQEIHIRKESIHGIMLEDMEQSKLAHIEQGLHRARTQAKAQQMAAADPTLRTAQMMGGPAMLQPGFGGGPGNGAFRGQ